MSDPLKVKAASGIRYPLEGTPSKHVTDAEALEVPDTAYYRKAIADGDLVLESAPEPTSVAAPVTTPKAKKD